MVKNMIDLTSRDHLIYLSLISLMAFVGACFSGNSLGHAEVELSIKIISIIILIISSFLVYFIILNHFQKSLIAFSVSALYLVAPTHFDIFVHPLQFQALLAEMFLLSFFILYQKDHIWKALIFLLITIFLNSKLIVLIPFLWGMKRLSILQKIYSVAVLGFLLIYLTPLMYKESFFAFNQFKTIFYIWENLVLAINTTILNISIIDPGHYSIWYLVISLITLLSLCVYGLKRKNDVLKIVMGLILASFIGTFVPYKQIFVAEEYFYYYLPSMYPMVLLSLLMLIACVLSEMSFREKMSKVVIGFIGIYWLGSTIYIQKNFQNIEFEWGHSMASLPQDFNYEQIIKLKYARFLIDTGRSGEAVKLIDKAKIEFPLVKWYAMLLEIANQRGDESEMEKIRSDLSKSAAPFENDEIEKD